VNVLIVLAVIACVAAIFYMLAALLCPEKF
jgi:hypothetical protein